MMTSVTLPSSSGPNIHGGFSDTATAAAAAAAGDFEPPRPPKRCLSTPPADTCKKRRKQATPVRISATDSPPAAEGKPPSPDRESSPSETPLQCPVCQLLFAAADQLRAHLASEHMCKQEPADSPPPETDNASDSDSQAGGQLTSGGNPGMEMKQELPPWLPDLPGSKDWMNPGLLGFPGAANSLFMGLPPFAAQPDAMPPRQPIRIFNPDAYCELCNKEFCNKYFLKTHKANKHGIYTDPPPDSNNPTSSSNSSIPSVNIPSYVNHMKMPPGLPTSLDLAVKMEKSYDMFTGPFGKMFGKTKPFETSEQELPSTDSGTIPTNADADNQQDESTSPRIIQNETTSNTSLKSEYDREPRTSEQEPFYTSPVKLSPGQQPSTGAQPQIPRESFQDLSARLRRIGVMNPKAFCEICCKEYCNKYFLRTHKMKRHGIFIPDDRDQVKSEGTNPYTQTSPLNLIMGEQSSNSSDRKTSSPSDISCETCGIKFQNASLFQLHNVSVHSKLPDPPQLFLNTNNETKKISEEKPANSAASSSADSISEDLQKLQTMILQLNDLDVSKVASTCSTCATCGKDFENRYYLHAHMMTEHGLLLDDPSENEKTPEADANSNLNSNLNNNTMCDLCGKDFPNFEDMKKHLYEAHKTSQVPLTEVKEEYNGFTTPEKTPRSGLNTPSGLPSTPGGPERRSSMNLTPTSSYCEICNKELCNKYFMKTHMQRMHGIEIENGAQIGGVICDICNKELCSKYFLRVHKHNTHGIVEYGSNLMQPKRFEDAGATPPATMAPPSSNIEDPSLKPTDLADLSHRYFSHFNEVCPLCNRRFRSTKWLKAHLLSDHGQVGAEKWAELEQQLQQSIGQQKSSSKSNERVSPTIKIPNNQNAEVLIQQQQQAKMQNVLSSIFGADADTGKTYHCSYCPFTTPVLPFLFVHERSHAQNADNPTSTNLEAGVLKCPVCMQSFAQPEQLQHHVFTQHPFLPLPPFFNGFNGSNDIQSVGDASKEPSECADDAEDTPSKTSKKVSVKRKLPEQGNEQSIDAANAKDLKEMARKSQLPATYALPQHDDENATASACQYVMQPFLLEETTNVLAVPSIVYLPVSSKLSSPITATFTLTPA
ncbi:zinc finger protein 423 [Atheta coriaria]|uniref:zinc finger protein 423 n=1 Tax=Dalotia coriaria TaxID=877792 RepID=UPI0031F344E3